MNILPDLKYSRSDEWVRLDGDTATIGITDYAQHELGEIVYLELPEVGTSVTAGVPFGVVESVKAVSELVSPLGGEVIEANEALTDDPAGINESPFENGWLIRVRVTDAAPLDELMDADAYATYRSDSGH